MAGDDRDCAELPHRARVADDYAVKQTPFDTRQRDAEENLPAAGAKHQRGLLLFNAGRLHHRDQFARDERKGHESGGQHDAGHGEDEWLR